METESKFDLVKLSKNRKDKLTTEVEFQNGMFFTVFYLPRPVLQKIFKESQTMKMNYKTQVREPEVNNDRFTERFCQEVLSGWRGFTPRKMASLIELDLSGFTEEELDTEIPFSQQQATYLVKTAYDLDTFLQTFVQDLQNFAPDKEYEEKNSEASQSGN